MAHRFTGRALTLLAFGAALTQLFGCAKKELVVAVEAPVAPLAEPEPAPPPPAPPPTIVLPGEIEFENNSPYVRQTAETLDLLGQLADILQKNPRITKLRIEGHTDNVGKAKHNQWLSQERANAVAHWLSEHDIDPSRLATVGYGDAHPLVDNSTAEHRRLNRRTEFHIEELDGDRVEDEVSQREVRE
jgi:OOP family OmpA-OmpF porin